MGSATSDCTSGFNRDCVCASHHAIGVVPAERQRIRAVDLEHEHEPVAAAAAARGGHAPYGLARAQQRGDHVQRQHRVEQTSFEVGDARLPADGAGVVEVRPN